MPKLKLTQTNIEKVRKPGGGTVIYWDTETKGFGLRVTNSGAASFIVQAMVAGTTKERRMTIGTYGAWEVSAARRRAEEMRHQFEDGVDPVEEKKAAKVAAITLQQVLESYVGRPGKLKDSTATEYRRHVEKMFTAWKDKPVTSITKEMVQARHRELVDGGLDGKKGAPASANAAMVTLRILINFAMDEYSDAKGDPVIVRNPVAVGLKRHWAKTGDRTERYIEQPEMGAVWNKLNELRVDPRSRDALAGIDLTIFLLLTGARRDEAAALTWDRVEIDHKEPTKCRWHLIERKRGKPIWLPLSSQAVALLKSRPRRKLDDGTESPFVFPSWSKSGRVMDARGAMETVSEVAGKHLSLHDLRRTFTNIAMHHCRIDKFRTDLLTGHKPSKDDVTASNYLNLTNMIWLNPEVQMIADWIEAQGREAAIKAAIAAGENVVEFAQSA